MNTPRQEDATNDKASFGTHRQRCSGCDNHSYDAHHIDSCVSRQRSSDDRIGQGSRATTTVTATSAARRVQELFHNNNVIWYCNGCSAQSRPACSTPAAPRSILGWDRGLTIGAHLGATIGMGFAKHQAIGPAGNLPSAPKSVPGGFGGSQMAPIVEPRAGWDAQRASGNFGGRPPPSGHQPRAGRRSAALR